MSTANFEKLDRELVNASAYSAALSPDRAPVSFEKKKKPKPSQATQLVQLAEGITTFHTPGQQGYAVLNVQGHQEVCALKSSAFRDWLDHLYYLCHERAPSASALTDAIATIESKTRYQSVEEAIYFRVAAYQDKILLDLGDNTWQCVEIDKSGWRLLEKPPVRFIRHPSMAPLPVPEPEGSLQPLWDLLNVQQEDSRKLLTAWLLAALRPQGPYPILLLEGEQGTSKSTTSTALRMLIDPSIVPLRSKPHKESDLFIMATNTWVMCYDNLSGLPTWLSDAFCRLSTGGGLSTRKLYSDAEELLLEAQRPIILNGIDDIASRSDLLDRALIVHLEPIPADKRMTEAAFWQAFNTVKPQVLGALLSAVAGAIAQLPFTSPPSLPRMADFTLWATAAEQALGWAPHSFISAYRANLSMGIATGVDVSPVGQVLCQLMQHKNYWQGTALELQACLEERAHLSLLRSQSWPRSLKAFSNAIKRLAAPLRDLGIQVTFHHSGKRYIRLESFTPANTQPAAMNSSPVDIQKGIQLLDTLAKHPIANTKDEEISLEL